MGDASGRRLLFIQYGTYREDLRRLSSGGAETYQAQRRAVEFICDTRDAGWEPVVVNMATDEAFDEAMPEGVRVIGLGPHGYRTGRRAWRKLLAELAPARIVLRTPLLPVLGHAARARCPTLAVFADSFAATGLRSRLWRWAFRRALNRTAIGYVGNHGRTASFQLAAMGVLPGKVVPWDWAPSRSPDEFTPRGASDDPVAPRILFAGALSEAKGVDDLVRAVAVLARRGRPASARLLGGGDAGRVRGLAETLGVAERVDVAGLVPNSQVVPEMRAADIVVIPSRHDYPEGLPLTIYEALIARTPIVASDHPMFAGSLADGESALVYPAGDAEALADRIERLARDPALYARLSANSAAAWRRLQLPVTFEALVGRWLVDDRAWLDAHSLAGLDYRVG